MMESAVLLVLVCVTKCSAMSRYELDDFADFLKKTSVLDQNLKDGTASDDDNSISDHAWEESGKFEGDLILNDRQRRLIVEDVAEGLSRNGLRDSTKRWPDNEVVYYIQREHFSSDQVQAIQDGIDDLAQASCIKFRPYKKGDRDAVVVQGSRRGCFSQVGYQGGYQVLNLSGRHPVGRGCFRHGTVVHEFLHTLGFYHMQSSPDRDDYIDVVWENIVQPAKHNFRKYNTFSVSDFGVGYDYDSVLHYSRKAFSSNGGDTLVPKQAAEIGQRTGLSDKDTQKLNKMYCDAGNNEQADPHTNHKVTKKKPKNEPFQGHGIGYHKGKTVAIKLPAARTFNIRDHAENHVFDSFSKAPKDLPPTLAEGAGIGEKVTYTIVKQHKYDRPALTSNLPRQTEKFQPTIHPQTEAAAKDALQTVKGQKSKELLEAFERLGMIIKSHVYPSQAPITEMYRNRYEEDYSDFVNIAMKSKTLSEAQNIDELFRGNTIVKTTSNPIEKLADDSNVTKDREELEIVSHPQNDPGSNHKYQSVFGEVDDSFGTFRKLIENSRIASPDYTFHQKGNIEDETATKGHDLKSISPETSSVQLDPPPHESHFSSTGKWYKPSHKYSEPSYEGAFTTERAQTEQDKIISLSESEAEEEPYLRIKDNPEVDYQAFFSIPEDFKYAEKNQHYSSLYEPGTKAGYTSPDSPIQMKHYKLYGETVPLAEPWFHYDKLGDYVLKTTIPTVDKNEPVVKKDGNKYNKAERSAKTYDYDYQQDSADTDDGNEDHDTHYDEDSMSIEELVMKKVNEHEYDESKEHSKEVNFSNDTTEVELGTQNGKDHQKLINNLRRSSKTNNSAEKEYSTTQEKSDAPHLSLSYNKTWDDDEEPTSFERAKFVRYNDYRHSREQKNRGTTTSTARPTPYRVTEERSDEVDEGGHSDSSINERRSINDNRGSSSKSEPTEEEEPRFVPLSSIEKIIDDRLKDALISYKEYESSEERIR